MPGPLRDVEQRVSLDASGYDAGARRVIEDNIAIMDSIDDVITKVGRLEGALGSLSGRHDINVNVTGSALADIAAIDSALGALHDREVTVRVRYVSEGDAGSAGIAGTLGGAGSAESLRVLRDTSGSLDQVGASLGRMEERLVSADSSADLARESFRDLGISLADVNDRMAKAAIASGDVMPKALDAVTAASEDATTRVISLADAHAILAGEALKSASAIEAAAQAQRAAAPAAWSPYGPEGGGGVWPAAAQPFLQSGLPGYSGERQPSAYYNPFTGGGGLTPAVAQPFFGDSGGGGGGGGAGFLGAFAGAFKPSNIFGNALSTVKMAHMIAMFTMETLSTVIPAGVAMAAAGAVGLQGGTNAYTTGTSLYNATESLGGAYGKTFGSYLGLGSSFQAAQNMANGGVYGITGGVLNLAGQGRDAFSNMGVQTVAMIDRGIANMVLGNRMQAVGAALAGGTQDLRSFGDVGANIGNTLLNLAPALPGLGPDLLGGLKGITGAASFITGHVPTPLLGAGLAAEAGYRWGDLALAGGKMPWFLGGKQFSGLSGLASRMGMGELPMSAAEAEAAGLLPEGAAAAGAEGIAGTGLAGLLAGGAAGLPVGALTAIAALSAYGISKGSFGTLAGRQMGGYLGSINQSFGANAWQPISKALYQAAGVQANLPGLSTDTVAGQQVTVGQPIGELMREGYSHSQAVAKYASEFASNTQQLAGMQANLIAAGPQAVKALQDMGYKGESVSQALTMMTDAMVSPSMIGAGGKISATGLQMMKQFMTTYSPMTGTGPGAILAGASAQDIMSYSGMKSLQTLNSAMDSVSQIITGGASGAAQQAAVQASLPSAKDMQKALAAGPFSAAGSSAWTAFTTGTPAMPGVISTLQSEGDQLRTYLTLGALGSGQAGSLGAYEAAQFLPDVKGSPAAMAMLAQQAVAAGAPGANYYNPKLSPAQNYAALQKALTQHGISTAHANALVQQASIKTADLPALAASLITSQSGASPLDTAEVTQAGTQALAIQQAVAAGKPLGGNLSGLVATLMAGQGAKYQPGAVSAGLKSVLGQEGIGGSSLSGLVKQGVIDYKAEYDRTNPPKETGTVDFKPVTEHFTPPSAPKGGTINYDSKVHPPAAPPAPHGGTVNYGSHVQTPVAPPAPAGGTVVYHSVVIGPGGVGAGAASAGGVRLLGQSGFKVPGTGSGDTVHAMLEPGELVVPRNMVASGAVDHLRGSIPGFQDGGVIGVPDYPGLGVSFRVAMQQVAEELLTDMQQAVGSAAGSIRGGMYSGGMYSGSGQAMAGTVAHGTTANPVAVHVASVAPPAAAALGGSSQFPGAAGPMPKAANKVIDAFEETFKNMPGPWNKLASQILTGLLDGVKNSTKETAAMATALVNKVTTEINYGRSVANTAVAGLNFPGMQVATPTMTAQGQPYQYYTDQQNIAAGGQPGSVQEQMSSYLQAEKSFGADMSKLSKGGLEKRLLSQLYAAGPIQGDAEAQSIMGGAGGIKAANSLYNQINSLATKLGVSAIGNVYGQPASHQASGAGLHGKDVKVPVHADTAGAQSAINAIHGKTVTIEVKVDLGGGGSGGSSSSSSSSGLTLSTQQVNAIASQVQSKLLQQAKNNRRTGTTLPGYGS